MQLRAFLLVAATALAMPSAIQAASGKGKPGYCADSTACASGYVCVSVQTTRSGVTDVKQCLPMNAANPVCTGTAPGLCPSFSTTWGKEFRDISSVCSYISPSSKCAASDATNSTKGTVECLTVQSPSDSSKTIGVIYGCVDFDGSRLLFETNSDSDKLAKQFNYTAIIKDKCINPKNPDGSNFVCSSQGTCAPTSAGSMEYSCECNVGFSGKYCSKVENNKCYNDGVCGGGSCDLAKQECTNCTAGTMGDKCAFCDSTYDSTKVCSAHGKCVAATSSGSSSTDSSSSTTTSPSSTTATPSSTAVKPSSKNTESSYSGNAAVSAGTDSSSSGATSAAVRFLASMASSSYTCTCDTGYSGNNCDVKLKTNSSSSSSTTAPESSSTAASVVVSAAGVVVAAVFASFTM